MPAYRATSVPKRTRFSLAVLAMASVLIQGCTTMSAPIHGYTCCNLRSQGENWISIDNIQDGQVLPLGQPAKLTDIKRGYYVYGTVAGRDYGFRNDGALTYGDTLKWVRRLIVTENPKIALYKWDPEIQRAVRFNRVLLGMTRAQVAMSISYPAPNDTPDLEAPSWSYRVGPDASPVEVVFDRAGRVSDLIGDRVDVAKLDGSSAQTQDTGRDGIPAALPARMSNR